MKKPGSQIILDEVRLQFITIVCRRLASYANKFEASTGHRHLDCLSSGLMHKVYNYSGYLLSSILVYIMPTDSLTPITLRYNLTSELPLHLTDHEIFVQSIRTCQYQEFGTLGAEK
jgi:hypothetical protein